MAKHNVIRNGKVYKICTAHIGLITDKVVGAWDNVRNCPECRCMGDVEDVSDAEIEADE